MSETDIERSLKLELMRMDLKTRQAFWETPRNIAILLATVGTLFGVVAGLIGFKLGQGQPQQIIVQMAPASPR